MKQFLSFLKKNWILIAILLLGIFLRVYKPLSFYMYGHDYDLAGWIIKDVVVNHHFRLIGQETSSLGIFIGPLFYYIQIPFYLITGMDPVGTLLLPLILSIFAIYSFYIVFSRVFDKRVGLIAALVYSASTLIIFTDREVVPTMPVILWTVWYFYSWWLVFKGNQKGYILAGLLFGLVWHLNLALALLSPLIILAQVFSKKKIEIKKILLGLLVFTLLMIPFFAFELRHGFTQTGAILSSFTSQKDYVEGTAVGIGKLDRVMQLVHTNATKIYWGAEIVSQKITFYLLAASLIFLIYKKEIDKRIGIVFILWQVLYVLFFTFNSINVSEYYLNGMNLVWIAVFSVGASCLFRKNKLLGFVILAVFILFNLKSYFTREVNKSGYIERKAVVEFIAKDAEVHGYPCVSVSHIASPGRELGYRYLFWLKNLHVNQPSSGSPVYTIVFPLSLVSGVDKTFGVIGLVLPDYERYTKKEIELSCSGENSNLTDPMFGYFQ